MAVSIRDVAVTKDYATWQDVKENIVNWDTVSDFNDWGSVYMYSKLPQPLTVGLNEQMRITVFAREVTWETISNDLQTWRDVKNLSNWNSILNYK